MYIAGWAECSYVLCVYMYFYFVCCTLQGHASNLCGLSRGLFVGMSALLGTGAHIPGLDYLWAFMPLLLCLNWLSYIAFLACVPAMMLCAFKAPHLTGHA